MRNTATTFQLANGALNSTDRLRREISGQWAFGLTADTAAKEGFLAFGTRTQAQRAARRHFAGARTVFILA